MSAQAFRNRAAPDVSRAFACRRIHKGEGMLGKQRWSSLYLASCECPGKASDAQIIWEPGQQWTQHHQERIGAQ